MKRKRKKQIEGYAVVLTWRYVDGSWNTETIPQDNLPDSFLDFINPSKNICEQVKFTSPAKTTSSYFS